MGSPHLVPARRWVLQVAPALALVLAIPAAADPRPEGTTVVCGAIAGPGERPSPSTDWCLRACLTGDADSVVVFPDEVSPEPLFVVSCKEGMGTIEPPPPPAPPEQEV